MANRTLNISEESHQKLDEITERGKKAALVNQLVAEHHERETNSNSADIIVSRVELAFFIGRLMQQLNVPQDKLYKLLDEYKTLSSAVKPGAEK